MKPVIFMLLAVIGFCTAARAQTVNQITILPTNPDANDTIYVISDFTYNGNCAFGMVYSYATVVDSTILIIPTYCGYMDTTLCNSIDTFQVGPFASGSYTLQVEYHQGSICPASGFDATIAFFDTSLVISGTTGMMDETATSAFSVYPNPVSNHLIIEMKEAQPGFRLRITNITGQQVFQCSLQQRQSVIDLTGITANGIYFLEIYNGRFLYRKKLTKL